jgi:hypothetical protein
MKRVCLITVSLTFVFTAFYSCLNLYEHEVRDREKMVEMTIHPETGYEKVFSVPLWTDILVYSDSDENQKQILFSSIEGFDFEEYERGYEYTFKAKKVWMSNPPMDGSNIKYIFVGPLEKKKAVVENSEENMELWVASETVKYVPSYPVEYENERYRRIYDALFCSATKTNVGWTNSYVLKEIEGFDFESGYEYILNVKKITQANPYSLRFVLIDIKEKQKAAMPEWLKR